MHYVGWVWEKTYVPLMPILNCKPCHITLKYRHEAHIPYMELEEGLGIMRLAERKKEQEKEKLMGATS